MDAPSQLFLLHYDVQRVGATLPFSADRVQRRGERSRAVSNRSGVSRVSIFFEDAGARGGFRKTDSRSPVLFSSRCSVLFLSRLVGKEHDPRRMRFGVDQFQLHLVLDVLKERLAAA